MSARRSARRAASLAAIACALAASPSLAQETAIIADQSANGATGTLVEAQADVTIIDGGTLSGGNLFHSFSQFDLASGESAQWVFSFGDPASIETIVNRVTGGAPSLIDGTLDATLIPNADFYFINPAGIVFGESAEVNVPAAAHFSTASHVDFADGTRFSAITPEGAAFTMAPPSTFGFLGDEGVLAVFGNQARPALGQVGELALSASTVAIFERSISADLIAMTATGTGQIDVGVRLANPDAAFGDGVIAIGGSTLSNPAATGIGLAAGTVQIADGSQLLSDAHEADGANLLFAAGDFALLGGSVLETRASGQGIGGLIRIDVLNSLIVDGSGIRTNTFAGGAAGDIIMGAAFIGLSGSEVISRSHAQASGASGNIQLGAQALELSNLSLIANDSLGSGTIGTIGLLAPTITLDGSGITQTNFGGFDISSIAIRAQDLALVNGSLILSESFAAARGSNIVVNVDRMLTEASAIASNTAGSGDSGAILIAADSLALLPGSQIASTTSGSGSGALVNIEAASVFAQNAAFLQRSLDRGASGAININAGTIEAIDSSFTSDAEASGAGGLIFLTADESIRLDGTILTSSALSAGDAGFIRLTAPAVEGAGLVVTAGTLGTGAGGLFTIDAQTLALEDALLIFSSFGEGAVGALRFTAGDVRLANTVFITEASGSGSGGLNAIFADTLTIEDRTVFSLTSSGAGDGGVLRIGAQELEIAGGSGFTALANGEGNAGAVLIEANTARIVNAGVQLGTTAAGDAGEFILFASDLSIRDSVIESNTAAAGRGGLVALAVDETLALARTTIATSAFAKGAAGLIELSARDISISASELDSASFGPGAAGSINVLGESIAMDGSLISTASTISDSGQIVFDAARIAISDSSISSTIGEAGASGLIGLLASESLALEASSVSSAAFGSSTGGNIVLSSPDVLVAASSIDANAFEGGDGGRVLIGGQGGAVRILDGSIVSVSTLRESNAGTITVSAQDVLVDDSIIASVIFGSGDAGMIRLEGDTLTLRSSAVSSSTFSFDEEFGLPTGNAGSISIDAGTAEFDFSDVTSSTGGLGDAGAIDVSADALSLSESVIVTSASPRAAGTAGDITLTIAGDLVLENLSAIASTNDGSNTGAGSSGTIAIAAATLDLVGASEITTNSAAGPAGNIAITLPGEGTLRLREGAGGPSVITTSSGPGTGGVIAIARPLAIISQGGEIRALGEQGGANVLLATPFFIEAADTADAVLVDGMLTFDGNLDYFAAGEEAQEINPLDAGAVLSGRCRSERASGAASQFSLAPTGPFARAPTGLTADAPEAPQAGAAGLDPCR
ncbi:MAG: filamentous hemagglutinin N-terminal domain-containing protein [Erythrobacter sp.]|jgi:filamentous hemagglutinin family protein|nr:filamentous hemagglutinin N-terminal domain-containing protein [Erythrobacter sp.]